MDVRCGLALAVACVAAPAFAGTLDTQNATRVLKTHAFAQYYDTTTDTIEDILDERTWTCLDFELVDESERSRVQALSRGDGIATQYSTLESTRFRATGLAYAAGGPGMSDTFGEGAGESSFHAEFVVAAPTYVRMRGEVWTYDVVAEGAPAGSAELRSAITLTSLNQTLLFTQSVTEFDTTKTFDRVILLPAGAYALECVSSALIVAPAGVSPDGFQGSAAFSINFEIVPAPASLGAPLLALSLLARRRR